MASPVSDPAALQRAIALLESIAEDRAVLAEVDPEIRKRLLMAAGQVARPSPRDRRQLAKAQRKRDRERARVANRALLDRTGIRVLRANPLFQTPRHSDKEASPPLLGSTEHARICYVCRKKFTEVHHFYDQLCSDCGDFNHSKRSPTADLSGRVALVTGSRVKIGFQAAVLLLRSGCSVVVTTRFPQDAARRYAALPDFEEHRDRIQIMGIDLRQVPRVEALCTTLLQRLDRLDFIINNACQTVRRPPGFYGHLIEAERSGPALTADAQGLVVASEREVVGELTQVPMLPEDVTTSELLFPAGRLDADEQQVDLREVNSWRLRMQEVSTLELLEVHLVNAVAPFILNARLAPLMARVPTADKHIVNVSAMEGQFYRILKSDKHPHTNMAKAALNMLTRTASLDVIEQGIHMNAVDTGWVTDEDPVHHAERKREQHGFHPPLDIVDGAARIVDPIFAGIQTGEHVWGQFLKDYKPTDW